MALLQIAECTAESRLRETGRGIHTGLNMMEDHISETSLTGLVSGMAGSRYFRYYQDNNNY